MIIIKMHFEVINAIGRGRRRDEIAVVLPIPSCYSGTPCYLVLSTTWHQLLLFFFFLVSPVKHLRPQQENIPDAICSVVTFMF